MKLFLLTMLFSFSTQAFDPTVTLEYKVKEIKRTNVLFVIDNSGSMNDYQQQVAGLSEVFLNELKDIHYKITAISTDPAETVENLVIYKKMKNPVANLQKLLTSFGTNGSATEIVFERAIAFTNREFGKTFLKGETPLEIIAVTDEAEQSLSDVDFFISSFKKNKMIFNGIIAKKESCKYAAETERFEQAAQKTGGDLISICQGTSQMSVDYENLARKIATRAAIVKKVPVRIIVIKEKIDIDSIKVFYGTQEIKKGLVDRGWVFNVSKNTIEFGKKIELDSNQPAGTSFTVQYNIL